MRVYCDMTGDLWHAGHMAFIAKAREVGERELEKKGRSGEKVTIVVGITADEHLADYKRKPVMTNAGGCSSAGGTRGVDEVIPNVPLVTSKAFMESHLLDLVVHGDDFTPEKTQIYYSAAVMNDQYREVPYTPGVNTSDLIRRVIAANPKEIQKAKITEVADASGGLASSAACITAANGKRAYNAVCLTALLSFSSGSFSCLPAHVLLLRI